MVFSFQIISLHFFSDYFAPPLPIAGFSCYNAVNKKEYPFIVELYIELPTANTEGMV